MHPRSDGGLTSGTSSTLMEWEALTIPCGLTADLSMLGSS